MHVIPALGIRRQVDPSGSMTRQANTLSEPQASERPYSHKVDRTFLRNDTGGCSLGLCVCVQASTHLSLSQTHTYTHFCSICLPNSYYLTNEQKQKRECK